MVEKFMGGKMKPEDSLLVRPLKGEDPRNPDDFEKLIRRFTHVVAQAGIVRTYRRHEAFEPASVKRRRKSAEARKRNNDS